MKLYPLLLLAWVAILPMQPCHSDDRKLRSLEELINRDEPGWDLVKEWAAAAKNKVEVLPRDEARAKKALLATQVTTRSPMGAVIWESGGILVDHGWLRILGSGHARLDRSLPEWNEGRTGGREDEAPPLLLVADDIVGGFFAINGGGLAKESRGKVFYLAPDTLEWENLNIGYSDFLVFCFSGDLANFYADRRWQEWEKEAASVSGSQALSLVPPLWAKEGRDISKSTRKAVPVTEIWSMQQEIRRKIGPAKEHPPAEKGHPDKGNPKPPAGGSDPKQK